MSKRVDEWGHEESWEDFWRRQAQRIMDDTPKDGNLYFITMGTGIPDEVALDYFKDSNVIVMTRDHAKWQRGIKLED